MIGTEVTAVSEYSGLSRTERLIIESKKRRNRELQRSLLILLLSVLLIITMTILFFGTRSRAAESAVSPVKCYASVQVASGETLYSIAQDYYSPRFKSIDRMVSEIRTINNMDNDKVISGLYIIVPYYSGD